MPVSIGAAVRAWTLVGLILGAGIVHASVWNNPLGGSWTDGTNWDSIPNGVGAIADFSTLDLTADATVTLDGAKTVGSLSFGDTTPSNNWNLNTGTAGGLTLSATVAGTASINVADQTTATFNTAITNAQGFIKTGAGTLILTAQAGAGAGNVTIKAGTVSITNLNLIGATPGSLTPNNVVIDGGILQVRVTVGPSNANRGMLLGPTSGSGAGRIEVTGSSVFSHSGILANNGAGTGGLTKIGTGGLLLSGANTYTGPTTINNGFISVANLKDGGTASGIGASSNLASNLVLDNGTLRYTGAAQSTNRLFTVGAAGGTIEANGTGALNLTNTGGIAFTAPNTPRTLNLIGTNTGANILAAAIGDAGAGATTLAHTGTGTWVLTGANTYTGPTTSNSGTLQIGNGGTTGTLGTGPVANDAALSFNRSDTITVNNAIGGGGMLNQIGTGTLKLTGVNTYTGDTNINAGTLAVTGSLAASGNVFVNANATLSGIGQVGNAIMQSGGSIRTGATGADGDVGTLTLNSFTVQGGDLRFDLLRPTATNDLINVLGSVSFNSSSTVSFTSVPATGNYTLITSTSPISLGVTPTLNVPTGTRATFNFDTTDPNKLGLIVGSAPKSLTWTGTAGSAWDLSTTINWSDNGGTTTNEKFFNLDSVTFGNVAANRNVNLDDVVLPSAVTVNNNAGNDYTISSATGLGGIGGAASLTKSGAGKLTITVNNTYTGPTTIDGGTIQVGSAGTTGSLGTGAITNNGTLAFNRSDGITVANNISGSGALQHLGPDALILTGANTYSGTTTIATGTLQVGDGGTTGTLGSGAVTNNGVLSFNRSDTITVANAINGTGALQQIGAGTTTLTGASSYTGPTNINVGTLNFTNLSNLGAGTAINFAGGTLQYATGAGNIDLSTRTLTMGVGGGTIDTNGNNVTFANSIGNGGAGGFTKAGAGTLTLNAPINYAGTTSVIGGTLIPGVANALGNNTNALNMGLAAGAGTLDLTTNGTTVTSLTASSNVAAATNSIQIGSGKTLTVNGNVAIGTLTGGTTVTNLTVTGAGGTLTTGTPGGTFAVGNISNAANSATSNATLDLSALGTFVANYGASGAIGIGTSPTATAGNGPNGTLILAGSNTLTAGTLRVSFGSNNGGTSNLRLGAANTINIDNLYVATGKGAGNLLFATGLANPSVTLRGADGVARVALMRLGDYSDYSAGGASTLANGVVNFTGGTVNAMVNDLTIGIGRIAGQNGGAATAAGTLTFDKGTIDVTTITLGKQSDTTTSPTAAGAAAAGTINVAGNASLIVGSGGITLGAGTPLGGAAATLFAGTLNITGGTITTAADILDGGGASTVTLNGGTLDLQNHNLGTDSPIDTLNFQAGTLRNVAQINAGASGLTKTATGTLTVAGTNAYTGPTTVNAGTLSVTGSIASSSGVTVNTGGTFDAAAAQRVNALTVNGGQARVVSAPTKFVLTVGDGTQSTSQLALSGGKLDLMTNGLAIRYAAGNDAAVLASVRAQVIAGYNPSTPTAGDGKWDGATGITSSSIGSLNAVGYALATDVLPFTNGMTDTFLGTTVDKNTVIARYTLSGDLNLDGSVDFLDLAKLAQSYNVTDGTRQWSSGDVNYDGNTDFLDLAKLAQNYNTALPSSPIPGASPDFNADLARAFAAAAAVPEPSTAVLTLIAAVSGFAARRTPRAPRAA